MPAHETYCRSEVLPGINLFPDVAVDNRSTADEEGFNFEDGFVTVLSPSELRRLKNLEGEESCSLEQ